METWVISSIVAMTAIISSVVTSLVIWFKWPHGTLRIDRSRLDKDLYRLDITDLDKLSNKKFVILTVDPNAILSQK